MKLPVAARRVVTEQDVLGALIALEGLPKRQLDDAEMVLASYVVALEGVAAVDLAEAARRVLKGELRHAFLPSPPELRIIVDRVRGEAEAPFARAAMAARVREQIADRKRVEPTAEAKARVAATYDRFCRAWAGTGNPRR